MPRFGAKSLRERATLHWMLQKLLDRVIESYDVSILEGKRSEQKQRANVARGVSKTLQSKHVYPLDSPSLAVDIAPYPLKWPKKPENVTLTPELRSYIKQTARFYHLAGFIKAIAETLGIKIRFGGDWDSDGDLEDQQFDDLPHYELEL